MIKNKISIEHQIDDRLHQYFIPHEASLFECKMIVKEIEKYIDARIEEAEKQKKSEENPPAEDVNVQK